MMSTVLALKISCVLIPFCLTAITPQSLLCQPLLSVLRWKPRGLQGLTQDSTELLVPRGSSLYTLLQCPGIRGCTPSSLEQTCSQVHHTRLN